MLTSGSRKGLKFFKIIPFQHETTYEMKYNCLAAERILFFSDVVKLFEIIFILTWNHSFRGQMPTRHIRLRQHEQELSSS